MAAGEVGGVGGAGGVAGVVGVERDPGHASGGFTGDADKNKTPGLKNLKVHRTENCTIPQDVCITCKGESTTD